MAYLSRTLTTGAGAVQTYAFTFPVLDAAEILVAVDGVDLSQTQLTVDVDAGTVTVGTGGGGHTFAGGETIIIWRRSPREDINRYIDPQDTAALSETELATLQLHLLHGVQELLDCVGGDDIRGPAGGLLTWEADGDPPSVLAAGAPGTTLTVDADGSLSWEADGVGAGAGEANTQSDAGATGEGLTMPKVGVDLPIKKIVAGANVTLDATVAGELAIAASIPGGTITGGNNVGTAGVGLHDGETAGLIDIRKLNSLSPIITLAVDAPNQKIDADVDQDQIRVSTGSTAGFLSAANHTKLAGIEPLADVTDATNVEAAGAVMETDFTGVYSMLVTDGTAGVPISRGIGSDTFVGRIASGAVGGMSLLQAQSQLGLIVERVFNISSPVVSDDTPAFYTTRAITVTSLHAVKVNGTSFTWNIRHHPNRDSGAANAVLSFDRTTTSGSAADTVVGGFSDNTIPANSFVWVDITAVSGAVDVATIELKATID